MGNFNLQDAYNQAGASGQSDAQGQQQTTTPDMTIAGSDVDKLEGFIQQNDCASACKYLQQLMQQSSSDQQQ